MMFFQEKLVELAPHPTVKAASRTVLAVEDVLFLLEILADVLEVDGYRVLRALNGEEAIDMLRNDAFEIDLLITDIRLPGPVDGWAVAEEGRRLSPDLPVIYLSGFTGDEPRKVRNSVFIAKPYRPSAILDAVRRYFALEA